MLPGRIKLLSSAQFQPEISEYKEATLEPIQEPTLTPATPAPAGLPVKTNLKAGDSPCWDPTYNNAHPEQCNVQGAP